MRRPSVGSGLFAAVVLTLCAAPFFVGPFYTSLLTQALMYAVLSMALNLVLGSAGLPSLGHAAFFGVAGYTVAILSHRGVQAAWIAAPLGLAAGAATAAVFGLLAVRARGVYFMLITLAMAQVVWAVAVGAIPLTGGEDGLAGVVRPSLGAWSLEGATPYYFVVLVVSLLALGVLRAINRSPFGLILVGIRDSETRMRALGYNVWLYKYIAFVLSGTIAGLVGVLFVYHTSFVSPAQLGILTSARIFLMALLGGTASLLGPAFGAFVLVFLEDFVSSHTQRWTMVLGILYIVVVLCARRGVYVAAAQLLARRHGRGHA